MSKRKNELTDDQRRILERIASEKLSSVDDEPIQFTEEEKARTQQRIEDMLEDDRQRLISIFIGALEKLISAGPDSFIVFSDKKHPDNYVQFMRDPPICEVSSRAWEDSELEPLDSEALSLLRERGFSTPDRPINPECRVDYNDIDAVAELTDWLFINVLGCGFGLEIDTEMELG